MRRVAAAVFIVTFATGCGSAGDGENFPIITRTAATARYAAVGQLRYGGSSWCTAVLVASSDASGAPAHALTNGHCVMDIGPEGANTVSFVEGPDALTIVFNMFQDQAANQQPITVAAIPYATMKGTDVAVVELATTVEAIRAQGLEPLPIGTAAPAASAAIEVVGIPFHELEFLRRASCHQRDRRTLIEGWYHFYDSHAPDCGMLGMGSSGSPMLDADGDIFALVNTGISKLGISNCSLDHPCEVGTTRAAPNPGNSYGVDVTGLGSCFGADGRFDLGATGCPLDPGVQLDIDPGLQSDVGSNQPVAWKWGATLSGSFPSFRYKTGPVHETDCRSPAGYSDPIALGNQAFADQVISTVSGFYFLCILAVGDAGAEAQSPMFPSVVVGRAGF